MSDLPAFVLNLSKSGNILFRNMSNEEIVSSASFSLVGEITHWCMNFDCLNDGRCWATCKCNICPTSCIEISSWKIPISNSRKVIFLLQDRVKHRNGLLEIAKQLNCLYQSMKYLSGKKHWLCVKIGYLHHFLCVLSLLSVLFLGSFLHLYWTNPEKKQGGWGYGISRVIKEIATGFSGC